MGSQEQETFQTALSLQPMFHGTQLVMRQLLRSEILLATKIPFFFSDGVLKWVAAALLTLQGAQVDTCMLLSCCKAWNFPSKQQLKQYA